MGDPPFLLTGHALPINIRKLIMLTGIYNDHIFRTSIVGEGLDPPLFPILPLSVSVDSGGSVTLPYSRCVVLAGGSVTLPYGRRIFGRGEPLPYTAPVLK